MAILHAMNSGMDGYPLGGISRLELAPGSAGSIGDGQRRAAGERNVLDQAICRVKNDVSHEFRSFIAANAERMLRAEEPQSEEELAQELLETLKAETLKGPKVVGAEVLDQELVLAIQEFGQAAHAAVTGASIDRTDILRCNTLRISSTGLSFLKSEEAYFVAPGDLLSHCGNLTEVGQIDGQKEGQQSNVSNKIM